MRINGFLRALGIGIGKQALRGLLPLVIETVANLDESDKSPSQKRASANRSLKRAAKDLGIEAATSASLNLLIEMAVNARKHGIKLRAR